MAAWDRFWCVTCQNEKYTSQRIYKTVYNGSTKRVKVMCASCVAGKREGKAGYYAEDEDDISIPTVIMAAYDEAHEVDV